MRENTITFDEKVKQSLWIINKENLKSIDCPTNGCIYCIVHYYGEVGNCSIKRKLDASNIISKFRRII